MVGAPAGSAGVDCGAHTMGATFTNVIHSSASINGVKMGIGNIIGKNVIIEPGVEIGNHNMILSNSVIAHDSIVGSYNFFGINTIIQGKVNIKDLVFFGARSLAEPNIQIRSRSVIMAGANIFNDVPESSMVVSRPAPIISIPKSSPHFIEIVDK